MPIATANELKIGVGCHALYRVGTLEFLVKIKDTRQRYGSLDALIAPEAGNGEKWVSVGSLSPLPPTGCGAGDMIFFPGS